MKTLDTFWRTVISLSILAAGVAIFFWLGTPKVETRPPRFGGEQMVRVVSAQDHQDGIEFEVDGVVVPFRQIRLAAQVSGRISYKSDSCRTGRAVTAGELLLKIDPSDYQLEAARLKEELKQADAMIQELRLEIVTAENQIELTKQQLEIDSRQLERNLTLQATAAASKSEIDTARRTELTTRNTLQGLQDNRNLLNQRLVRMESGKTLVQANLDKAELALERTEIRAPLDGVVVQENVEQDGYILAGNALLTLQDTSQLDVTCKLHMRQMHWLWQGDSSRRSGDTESGIDGEQEQSIPLFDAYEFPETPANVLYKLGPATYEWSGVLNRYDGAGIDNQTRMIPCRVNVADPLNVTQLAAGEESEMGANPPTLMTGMFVKVHVNAMPPIPLVRIPQEALQPGNAVWIVVDGKLKRMEARVAASNEEFVVAYQEEDGLQAGDRVVVSPLATPLDGLAVKEVGTK